MAEPPDERLESALASELPGTIVHRGDDAIRALVPVARRGAEAVIDDRAIDPGRAWRRRASGSRAPAPSPRRTSTASRRRATRSPAPPSSVGSRTSSPTTSSAPTSTCSESRTEARIRDATIDAVGRLAAYDEQRQTQLLQTLEEFLRRRGNISATAEALFVHPNTLRQRLRRIGELTDLDLRADDWLEIEIAVKLVRLRRASAMDTAEP